MTDSIMASSDITVANPTACRAVQARDRAAEASHRIANQLGQLAILLEKQIRSLQSGPEVISRAAAVDALRLHHGRLHAIARLHRAISRTPDDGVVALQQVLPDLFREFQECGLFDDRLRLEWTLADGCSVGATQATALMLAFSEIVTNAMKYAHPTALPVELAVVATPTADGGIAFTIGDDGVGLPEGFVEARDAGMGLRLVRSLIESVGGRVELHSDALGLTFHIELPPR